MRVGMLTVAIELCKAMVAHRGKDEMVLLCSKDRPEALQDLDGEAVLAPYRHEVVLKTRWLPHVEPLLECDAILYPYWPSPPFRRPGAPPAAVFVHDLAFRLTPSGVPWQQRAYMGFMLPAALRQAAAVLVPSESTKRDLLEQYKTRVHEDDVEVVPEGLPAATPAGPLPEGLERGFILAVGTVEPRKNYPRLLAAYRQLRRNHVPLMIGGRPGVPQLVIAGRPGWAYGDTLQRITSEPGVRYLGHVDEPTLSALYESAAVLAFPSLYEGFGLPLLEAMARGLPAVVGATGALPELAGDAAMLVDPEDVDEIAYGLGRVLSDEGLRRRLREASLERAREFTWERTAGLTRKALRDIARVRS